MESARRLGGFLFRGIVFQFFGVFFSSLWSGWVCSCVVRLLGCFTGFLGCCCFLLFGCLAVGLLGWWAGRLFDSRVLFLLLGFMFVIGSSCSWVARLLSCWAVVAFCCWAGAVVGLVGCWATGLLGCWAVGLLSCWAGFLSCWAVGLGCWAGGLSELSGFRV